MFGLLYPSQGHWEGADMAKVGYTLDESPVHRMIKVRICGFNTLLKGTTTVL